MVEEFKDDYRWLSNFAPVEIEFDGITYPSIEHFYVSQKTEDISIREKIAEMEFPAQAKKYGQKISLRENWDEVKILVMSYGLSIKFSKEPYKTLLLETGDEYIQEGNWWGDTFWGVDLKTGEGKNMLGKMIMEIREQLK